MSNFRTFLMNHSYADEIQRLQSVAYPFSSVNLFLASSTSGIPGSDGMIRNAKKRKVDLRRS
jgi:hypothetical protein